MCFTVNVNLIKEELENRFGATLIDPDKYRPSYYYHAFGLPELPVVCSETRDNIKLMVWGLIPSWTKNEEDAKVIRFKTFNARSESISRKPSFSASFKKQRCIIPVKGYFEWQHVGREKIPWYIYDSEDEILSLAGLYNRWTSNVTGEVMDTFSIVTTDANNFTAEIHNTGKRMPAILDKDAESKWLNLSLGEKEILDLLKPAPESALKAHPVSPLINNKTANKNTPKVIQPYLYTTQSLLF
jgi:putative SOS response-associated peptidase YedK